MTWSNELASEIFVGENSTVIWNLKGWGKDRHRECLIAHSSCFVDLFGHNNKTADGSHPIAQLRFYLKENVEVDDAADNWETRWLSLNVDEVFNLKDQVFQYDFQVEVVKNQRGGELVMEGVTSLKISGHRLYLVPLEARFIKLGGRAIDGNDPGLVVVPQPEDLCLKISVTPFFVSAEAEAEYID